MVAVILFSCKKNGSSDNNGNGNNTTPTNADSVSVRLQFFSPTKVQGTAPKGPTGSRIKISIKDTLFLTDQIKFPIKFLNTDTTKDIKGAFIQVMGLSGGPLSTNYLDVPVTPEVDTTSDSVDIVMIGIDPTGLKLPFDFNITITPHNSSGQPLAQTIKPVRVLEHHNDPKPASGSCGIVLPPSKIWQWQCSYINAHTPAIGHPYDFFDDPNTVFNRNGQMIQGSCCAGISIYPDACPGERLPNRTMHFATYYQITHERFIFDELGGYLRLTSEEKPAPLPDKSDFCVGGEGVIDPHLSNTTYNGTYSITPATIPSDLKIWKDSLQLNFTQTSSSGGAGFGNGGGIIHQLDCVHGELVLIQPDLEGFGQHLFRIYTAQFPEDPVWVDM